MRMTHDEDNEDVEDNEDEGTNNKKNVLINNNTTATTNESFDGTTTSTTTNTSSSMTKKRTKIIKNILLVLLRVKKDKRLLMYCNKFDQEGKLFRKNITSKDMKTLKLARLWFHLCSLIPMFVYYYFGVIDKPPKFPATISFTIRKGITKKLSFVTWIIGWSCVYNVIQRRCGGRPSSLFSSLLPKLYCNSTTTKPSSSLITNFITCMIGTGLWTTQLFPIGRDTLSDVFHFCGASIYMIQHIVLMDVLKMKSSHRRRFYTSLVTLLLSVATVRTIERRQPQLFHVEGAAPKGKTHSTAKYRRQIEKLPTNVRNLLFLADLIVMISENLLFTSFVHGIPSGLVDIVQQQKGKKEANNNNNNNTKNYDKDDDNNHWKEDEKKK